MGRVNPAELEITFATGDVRTYSLIHPSKGKPFEEFIEPLVERQAQIAGSSRNDADPRRDIHTLTLDDWSAGQLGDGFYNPQDERMRKGYRSSDGAVSPTEVPGAVGLGKDLSVSKGDFPSVSGDGWVFTASRKTGARTVAGYVGASTLYWASTPTTWSSTALGSAIASEFATDGENVYVSAAAGVIRRWDASDVIQTYVNEGCAHMVVANERLYYYRRTAGQHEIKRAPLTGTIPVTGTKIGTVPAVEYTSNMVAVGATVYFVTGNGAVHDLWAIVNDVVTHAGRLPVGFVPASRAAASGTSLIAYSALAVVGDTLVIAGRVAPSGSRYEHRAALVIMRPGEDLQTIILPVASKDAGVGSSVFASCVAAGPGNSVLIGIDFEPFSPQHRILQLDLETGALWEPISGARASATDPLNSHPLALIYDFNNGVTFMGRIRSTHLWYTDLNDVSVKINHHPWDFGLPSVRKLLYQVEIRADLMDDDTEIEVSFTLDDGAEITTDADGNTIELLSSAGTNLKTFTISKAATERLFNYMTPSITLKATGQTVLPESPYAAGVTFRALSTGNVRYYKYVIDCSDETSLNRRPGRQTHQQAIIEELRELRDTASNRIFSVRPLYTSSGAGTTTPWPTPDDVEAAFDCVVMGWHLISDEPGKGAVELLLRRLD